MSRQKVYKAVSLGTLVPWEEPWPWACGIWTTHLLSGSFSFSPKISRLDEVGSRVPAGQRLSQCPFPVPFSEWALPQQTSLSFSLMSLTTLCVWMMSWASSILKLRCPIRYCWLGWAGVGLSEGGARGSAVALSLERTRDRVLTGAGPSCCRDESHVHQIV